MTKPSVPGRLFVLFQYLLPHHLLSGLMYRITRVRWKPFKNLLIRRIIAHYRVEMSLAEESDPQLYPSFNAFFTRALRPNARPLAAGNDAVLCPADGRISQTGCIIQGEIFQAKGHQYSLQELLGGATDWLEPFRDGGFATIYLSPRDYHRVHMPLAGKLLGTTYIPGDLYSVNTTTAENVERLFARNERLVSYFDTPAGPMAMVLVGAMVVAGIETVWGGQVAPPPKTPVSQDYRQAPQAVALASGEEMGRFKLGSTVILLFPENAVDWDPRYAASTPTRLGEPLASIKPH